MMTDNNSDRRECFTSIQSRKLFGGLESCELCPSMDLILFSKSTSSQLHSLFRTVSWQKVATISSPSTSLPDIDDGADEECAKQAHTSAAPSIACWSPSGTWIAVAHNKKVSLYGVETLANPPGGATFSTSSSTEEQHSWNLDHPVVALAWAHVGQVHPSAWKSLDDETEAEISWRYQSGYVDQAKQFLPPSAYLQPTEEDEQRRHQENTSATALPECKTPLSVLCVSTTETLELYLHGRYPLLTLDRNVSADETTFLPPQVVFSNDLSYMFVHSQSHLSLYHLPFLKRDRYPLQIIASLHASITSHLSVLQQSTVEVLNSWKTSLKPLDTKLQPLLKLLHNYGVDDQPLGTILKQYILVGHTCESSSVANAMDQFFTSVQMNDQLLQRMERGLHSALANVESTARKSLLSPTQALCYDIQELAGHVQYHSPSSSGSKEALQQLINASHHLWISVEALILAIVKGRFLVRDFCDWLRSAGSQIKAKGTAYNSVQRENAKKRRVPQAVLERLMSTLNTAHISDSPDNLNGVSEHVLNLPVTKLLKDTKIPAPLSKAANLNLDRPSSPSSVAALENSTPTVVHAVKLTLDAARIVLSDPLSNIPKTITPRDFALPTNHSSAVHAIHTRIGRDANVYDFWQDDDDDKEGQPTYFSPRVFSKDYPDGVETVNCRQWAITAQAQANEVQLFGFPLGWKDAEDEDEDEDDFEDEQATVDLPFYITSKLVLPTGGAIKDIAFYGDDGKSTLSSGNDSGSGKEGRQKIGILYEQDSRLVLWLTSYSNLLWQTVPCLPRLVDASKVESPCITRLRASEQEEGEAPESGDMAIAQTRTVAELEAESSQVRLVLSGSRGVGVVAILTQGVTTMELLDLEEDEEGEEEDEEEEDDDDILEED